MKRAVEEKLQRHRARAMSGRRAELDRARRLIGLGLAMEVNTGPGVLGRPIGSAWSPASDGSGALDAVIGPGGGEDAEPSDDDYASSDLAAAIAWLEAKSGRLYSPLRSADLESILAALRALEADERAAVEELQREHRVLGSRLYFRWVYHEGAGWILEVAVWALAGMLCNTLIALIVLTYKGTYHAARFATVFPKLILAPLLAVVFTAMWSSGFTESGVTYVNLPYFLVTSFVLGYATEQLFSKLRDVVGVILGSAGISEERLRMAGSLTPYTFVNPPESAWALTPTNLPELREKAKRVARHELEKGIVAELAGRPASEARSVEVA